MRNNTFAVARDNVVFEAGLFMGELGRDRVFIISPRDISDFHLLSDLSGFTAETYDSARAKRDGETKAALATAASNIKDAIKNSSWNILKLKIEARCLPDLIQGRRYPLKLDFKIKNINPYPLIVQSIAFELNPNLKFEENSDERQQKPLFKRVESDTKHTHVYKAQTTIEIGESVTSCWLPIDPTVGKDTLEKAVKEKKTGRWVYRCIWLKEHVIVCNYEENF